ncbi:MAG: hypothetical protein WDM91_15480 [Rhizomicrobium sp.]
MVAWLVAVAAGVILDLLVMPALGAGPQQSLRVHPDPDPRAASALFIEWTLLVHAMAGVVIVACALSDVRDIAMGLQIGVLVWLVVPCLILILNGLFARLDSGIAFAYGLGSLARLELAGLAAGYVLSP